VGFELAAQGGLVNHGHEDDRKIVDLAQATGNFAAVDSGQPAVEKSKVRLEGRCRFKGSGPV